MEGKSQQETAQIETTPEEVAPIASEVLEETKKRWTKPLIFSVLGLIVSSGLFLGGYKLALIRQVQTQPTPTPVTVTTPIVAEESKDNTTACLYETINAGDFEDIDFYINKDVCQKNYLSWKTATSSKLFSLKHPSYYKHNLDYGADSFEIEHPTLGNFRITTFIHDYNGEENNFNDILCAIAEGGHISKEMSEYSFYREGTKYYVVGDNKVIIAKDKTPDIWGFSIMNAQTESQLTWTEDFKCFVLSVELLD